MNITALQFNIFIVVILAFARPNLYLSYRNHDLNEIKQILFTYG